MTSPKYATVVVPVDFSDDSEAAVRAGLAQVADPAGLHLVHVLHQLDYGSPGVLREMVGGGDRETPARTRLGDLIERTGADGARAVLLTGDPGLETADYAGEVKADLIVVPSHGYHGVKRLLLGSTAERIIRHAGCSVLVLRRKDAD